MNAEKLDNPTWYALTETHKEFAIDYDGIKFYHPDYCPFGGFINENATKNGIDNYAQLQNSFYVVGNRPAFEGVFLEKELVCDQMLLDQKIDLEISHPITVLESIIQKKELFELVNLVQPGYFKSKTADLGNYYGIYSAGKLVAVTGERMKMDGYTEVSAVVTHPEYTGRGYAKQLVAYACNQIFNSDQFPYLHVADTNVGAIALYEKLGFRTRRKMSFWKFSV